MRKILVLAFLAGTAPLWSPANAATFFMGDSSTIDNKVKAFSDDAHPTTGSSVYGSTAAEGQLVKFTGNSMLGITSGNGYAQISNGDSRQGAWNNVTIALDSYAYGFSAIEFALQFNNADVSKQNPGTLGITANFLSGPSEFFAINDFKNAANRSFYLIAGAGQQLSSIVLSSGPDRLAQLKQVDITLAAAPPQNDPPPVPEPASWATMVIGFGIAGALLRRRAAKIQFS